MQSQMSILTKQEKQFIKSLKTKEVRQSEQLFIAEGSRLVNDLIITNPHLIHSLYGTKEWLENGSVKLQHISHSAKIIKAQELEQIAQLRTTTEVLGLFKMPSFNSSMYNSAPKIALFLEKISDPGNMGTIIRSCDWFGISTLFVSPNCVDQYNSKCIQASMASIARVKVVEIPFTDLKAQLKNHVFYSTSPLLESQSKPIPEALNKIICIGNEAHGLSEEILKSCEASLHITSEFTLGAESLNAAVSAAILLFNQITKDK